MATKFVSLTEAKFPKDLAESRKRIRALHEKLAAEMAVFKPLAATYVQDTAKHNVALIGDPATPAAIKTACTESLVKLGADETGTIPNIANLVYSFRYGTAVVVGETRKAKGASKAAVF